MEYSIGNRCCFVPEYPVDFGVSGVLPEDIEETPDCTGASMEESPTSTLLCYIWYMPITGLWLLSRNMRNRPKVRYPQQESPQPLQVVDMNRWRWWLRLQRLDMLHWCGTADREGQDNEIVIMDLGFQYYIEDLEDH